MERLFILPGECHLTRNPKIIGTVLGSCVSVCLYHREAGASAMNHFVIAQSTEKTSRLGYYGNLSIEYMVKNLMAIDPRLRNFEAKLFGGGNINNHLKIGKGIGQDNIKTARVLLAKYGIPIVAEDVGGEQSRRIYFNTERFEVSVEYIEESIGYLGKAIRVLIVDDSELVRSILRKAIEESPGFEVVAEAADAYEARSLILQENPDVVTLDIIMPKLTGLDFLKKLMEHFPIPVVIISTMAKDDSMMAKRAVEHGACGVIDKEKLELYKGIDVVQRDLIPILRQAASSDKACFLKGRHDS